MPIRIKDILKKKTKCSGCKCKFIPNDSTASVHRLNAPNATPWKLCENCADIMDQLANMVNNGESSN